MAALKLIMKIMHNQRFKNAMLTVAILLSIFGTVHAEQATTIKYLMTEPLTLFDLGIYKLDKFINEDPVLNATVKFDPKSNKINIHVVIYEMFAQRGLRKSQSKKEAFELLDSMVRTIRTKLGVNHLTGKVTSDNTALEECFRPANGRVIENEPDSLKEDLFNMIEISVRLSGGDFNLNGKAALKGTEIVYNK